MFVLQMSLLLILGLVIGLSTGFLAQYWYLKSQQQRKQVATYRQQWRYYSVRQLEDILARPSTHLPSAARKAARQLLNERRQLVS